MRYKDEGLKTLLMRLPSTLYMFKNKSLKPVGLMQQRFGFTEVANDLQQRNKERRKKKETKTNENENKKDTAGMKGMT